MWHAKAGNTEMNRGALKGERHPEEPPDSMNLCNTDLSCVLSVDLTSLPSLLSSYNHPALEAPLPILEGFHSC